jgi:FixJ family two-component response regulator
MTPATPTVCVVDDDISIRESLELLILSDGWRVELFACAQAFLQRPRGQPPGCVILDMNLPDLNGLDLQQIATAELAGTPIIVITGSDDAPLALRATNAGAFEFMAKPFDAESLLSAVRRAIERKP